MKKAELIKRLFTNEEIVAIDNRNRELEEENKRLQSSLDYANRDREDMHNKIIELGNKRESQKNMNYKLRKENKNLKEKQKVLDKENCKFIDENVKLKKRIYQNVHGGPRIDYQDFCKKNGI